MKKEISIQELKIILLETMDVIDEFCRDNGIHYFLLAGSLLGAVRHKGFIPWDDDIDIGMFREDYDRFVSIFSSCKSNHVRLLCPENDAKYSYGFAKVVDTRTTVVENVDNSDELGVYVDVFPLDNCTSSLNFASNYVKGFFFLKCLNNFKVIKIDKKRSALKNFILAVGKVLTFFISRRMITNAIVKRSKRFQYEDSKFIAEMTGNVYGTKEIWEKEWFSELIDAQFEGRQYSIPKEYDKILTRTYGNYMELPPLYKRASHHEFIAFWK